MLQIFINQIAISRKQTFFCVTGKEKKYKANETSGWESFKFFTISRNVIFTHTCVFYFFYFNLGTARQLECDIR